MPILTLRNCLLLPALATVCGVASAAVTPYVQLVSSPVAPGTCTHDGPTPAIAANFDLGANGSYRYSPAYVPPLFFDDEGDFNLVWNQDATLFVSGHLRVDGARVRMPLPLASLEAWFAGFGRVAEHTELALRVAAYDAAGRVVATSRITWDCTTGAILHVEHRDNAAGAVRARLVEYHHAQLDHYFMTVDPAEIEALDTGAHAGWGRTGQTIDATAAPDGAASAVCRFYLPPASGDSHFYSASAQECAAVRARFPEFVLETDTAFAAALPDLATGACASGKPVYRLWNGRADGNHRYTTDPSTRVAMIARGYVAEGYGLYGVAFCTTD